VTRIPSTKNCNFPLPFLRIMDTPLNRYDEPWNRRQRLLRHTISLHQLHT
jgi:hypothetical protein